MSAAAPLLVVLAVAAVWPFGRHRDKETGTIKDLEAAVVEIDTSASIEGSEAKAMESYRLFLDLASDDPQLSAEAMRRLADLQLETSEAVQLQNNLQSLGAFGDTIQMYEQLLKTYPRYAKNDLVLYQLARAYEADGRPEDALRTLDRLIAEYPQTPHFDEAQFRRGETLFAAKRYAEAEAAYADVLKIGPSSTFYDQSLYKHGWSLFKQQEYQRSLDSFFALLDREFQVGADAEVDPAVLYSQMNRAEQELVDDTLRVLSIDFSYLDGPESITDYFNARGTRSYSFIVYMNLGDLYLEQERFQDAADAYAAFVALDAYHAKAPLLQVEVIEAFKQGGFADLVLEGKQGFVETYGPGSPYWQRFTYEQQPEVVAHLKANVTDLAAHHHAQAQSTKDPAEYAAAARWYRTYLQSFPDDPNAPETNFLLGEVLYESGNYGEAALEYERTAYAYPFHAHGGEAGYAALLAYAKHEETLTGVARSEWHRQAIESALRFASSYPTHEQAAVVETDAAEKLFALNDFARARDVGRQVVARDPAPDLALQRTAWAVIAHSEFDLQNFVEAEAAYQNLYALLAPDAAERADVVERIASSIYKQGEQARAAGDNAAAVEHFLRVSTAAPTSSIRATAEYDAAAALIQLGDWSRATTVLENFRASFPNHPLAADATANLAVAYVEVGNGVRAAGEFERIADGDAEPEVKKEALWRAAELYEQNGQTSAAAGAWTRYVERYPFPVAESIEARQKLLEIATASGDHAARTRWLQDIVAADASAGAERSDRTRFLAASAQLALAQPARDAFLGTRLVVPLDKSLQAKQARMEEALAAYGKAADYGVAQVTTAANYEIAELYHALSRDLFDSERPPDLTEAELEQYDLLLEEQAYPFEEEAIELHELNAARTADGIYDEWVRKSIEQLAMLLPVRYAKSELPVLAEIAPRAVADAAADDEPRAKRRRDKRSRSDEAEPAEPTTAPLSPAAVQAHEQALAAIRAEDWIEAELALEQFVLEHPDVASAHVNLATVYLHDDRPADARAALEQALALDPAHPAANTALGAALRAEGKFDEAESAYRRALDAAPEYAPAHYNLGVLLDVYLRRQADALEHYERYQASLAAPDEAVGRWIIDLRRRLGVPSESAASVARENGQ